MTAPVSVNQLVGIVVRVLSSTINMKFKFPKQYTVQNLVIRKEPYTAYMVGKVMAALKGPTGFVWVHKDYRG